MGLLPDTAAGAAGGLVATAAMSAVMVAARGTGLIERLPPHELTTKTMARTGTADDVDPEDRHRLGWATHFAFGAAAGAAFGILRRLVRRPGPDAGYGIAWGLLVWLVSYQGWIPALHLLPPAEEDHPTRPAAMVAAHVVFGAVLGPAWRAIRGQLRSA